MGPLTRSLAFIKTTMTIAGHCPPENKRTSNSFFGMNAELEFHVGSLFMNNAAKDSGVQLHFQSVSSGSSAADQGFVSVC